MENWLPIVTGVYLVIMILYGHYRGFIRLAVSLVALVAALVIVNLSMPAVTTFLKENTQIHKSLQDSMKKASGLESAGGDDEELPAMQRAIIENLNLPQQMKDALIENNNHEIYQMLGVEAFTDYVGNYLADMILNTLGFIIMFVIVYFILQLLMRWLDILARLPLLSGINKVAGALLGGVEGLIFLWIICLVITACAGTSWGMSLIKQIESSNWLSFVYNNNILNLLIKGVVRGML